MHSNFQIVLVSLLLSVLCNFCPANVSARAPWSAKMEEHGVVPDVISSVPEQLMEVYYDNGLEVNQGNVLTPTQVKDIPTVRWKADASSFYTLCLTDPDAPSRTEPSYREFLHWLVVNIPGSEILKGETIVEFIGSGPPKNSGLHRYVFVAYKQPKKLEFDEPIVSKTSAAHRPKFSIQKFATKYNMKLVAVNFYQAEYDSYVDILHRQLNK